MRKWFQNFKKSVGDVVFLSLAVSKEDVVIHFIRHPSNPQLVPDVDSYRIVGCWDGAMLVFYLLIDFLICDLFEDLKWGLFV